MSSCEAPRRWESTATLDPSGIEAASQIGQHRRTSQRRMRRFFVMTAVLAFAVSASAQSTDYFPDGVFGPRTHDYVERWYSRHLSTMGEPSLYAIRGHDRHVVRLLRLPTWGAPTAIRAERDARGITLTRRTLSGQGGYDPGHLASESTRTLRPEDWQAIERALRDGQVFELPATSDLGNDGEQWILEVVDGDRYHVVDRWTAEGTPDEPALRRIGELLERLAR